MSETAVRVILAEKRLLFREGLVALCDRKGPLEIAATADDVDALLRICKETEADVLICGDSLRGGECTDVASRLRDDGSSLPMLLITSRPEEHYITSCLSAGIVGFITIDDTSETLFKAAEALMSQDMAWLSPSVSSCILPRYRAESPGERLTDREVEVLKHASLGKTNDQISELLHVAPGTVRNYLSSIYQKVGVGSRAEAIAWAWQSGLVRRRPRL